jgi:predicted CXXCH cytochrome family protein
VQGRWRRPAARTWALGLGLALIACVLLAAWARQGRMPAAPGQVANDATGTTTMQAAQPHAGSASCAGCHREIHAAWQASQHALAERAFDPRGADAAALAAVSGAGTVATLGLPPAGTPIARGIGVAPLQQWLVPMADGRVQVTSAAWDPQRREWFDVFADGRRPDEWGHWRGRGMNWNSMCAACHNTGVDKGYDLATDRYATRVSEHGVGCEACHGPLGEHARQAGANTPAQARGAAAGALINPRALSAARSESTCGACHARRAELTGRFRPGDAFADHFLLTFVGDGEAHHPDGQVHEENFEYAAFLGSRMHAAGVGCGDCHDPHSGKLRTQGNALCQQCHAPGARADAPDIAEATHTHHAPGSEGHACVSCHMPQTTYMQRDPRRDHGFTSPDPLLTVEAGIPNACNRCHADETPQWALGHANAWYGTRLERPARARARTLAAARAGEEGAGLPQSLVALMTSRDPPVWRASAMLLAGPWVTAPDVRQALVDALSDPDAGVREAAVRTLGEQAGADPTVAPLLRPRLDDAVRAVRVSAAWALRAELDPGASAGADLQRMLLVNADQPAGQLRLGQFHAARGDAARALQHMRTAIAWDRHSAPPHRDLALLLARTGDLRAATTSLAEAVRIAPDVATYHHELGMLRAETGDAAGALAAFERTVQLAPGLGRAWYNLGLARAGQQDARGALAALARAEALASGPGPSAGAGAGAGDAAYAAATLHLQAGDMRAARAAVSRALALEPGHGPALALARQLAEAGPGTAARGR